jgi:hypothetical protein
VNEESLSRYRLVEFKIIGPSIQEAHEVLGQPRELIEKWGLPCCVCGDAVYIQMLEVFHKYVVLKRNVLCFPCASVAFVEERHIDKESTNGDISPRLRLDGDRLH